MTNAEYLTLKARIVAGKARKAGWEADGFTVKAVDSGPQTPTGRESDLHDDVIAELRRRGWLYFRGNMGERTSRTLGEPDFTIIGSGGRVFFVELKTRTGKLSPAQLAVATHAHSLGVQVHVVRSMAEFHTLVGQP